MVTKGGSYTQVIEADSAEELRDRVISLAKVMGATPTSTSPTKTAASSEAVPQAPKAKAAPKGKAAAKPAPAVEEAETATAAEDVPATEDVADSADEEGGGEETTDDIFGSDEGPAAPVAKAAKKLEFKDVEAAIRSVVDAEGKGIEVAKKVMAQFKDKDGHPCKRITAVLSADYHKFVAACNKALT
jgi:hypothetical protein